MEEMIINESITEDTPTENGEIDAKDFESIEGEDIPSTEEHSKVPEDGENIESIKAELSALRAEMTEKRAAFERMAGEVNEFSELFPHVSLSSIPDSVWENVKKGIPIAAAYALYEKKTALIAADAEKANCKNHALSTGPLGKEPTSDFFSPADVKAMSREEVRKNYPKIMESMKKWN